MVKETRKEKMYYLLLIVWCNAEFREGLEDGNKVYRRCRLCSMDMRLRRTWLRAVRNENGEPFYSCCVRTGIS